MEKLISTIVDKIKDHLNAVETNSAQDEYDYELKSESPAPKK